MESDCDCLMWRGRVFQTLGAEMRKAREPNDRLWCGTKSSWEEGIDFEVVWRCMTSARYGGRPVCSECGEFEPDSPVYWWPMDTHRQTHRHTGRQTSKLTDWETTRQTESKMEFLLVDTLYRQSSDAPDFHFQNLYRDRLGQWVRTPLWYPQTWPALHLQ